MLPIRNYITWACLLLIALLAVINPLAAVASAVMLGAVQLKPQAMFCEATLVLPILTKKVIKAFRKFMLKADVFSVDFGGAEGNFAQPVYWEQEVISPMALPPTVTNHTPGDDLTAGAQNPKDLLVNVKVKIDRCKKVTLTIPPGDAATMDMSPAIASSMEGAGYELGRAVLLDGISQATRANFSRSLTETVAGADYDTLKKARLALNAVGARTPRFFIGNSDFIANVADTLEIQSRDYQGQMQEAEPYTHLKNVEGFNDVFELPDFPALNATIGTFTAVAATDVITSAGHGLQNGDRVRVSSTTTLPAGLAAATDYYVIERTTDTFKLSATSGGSAVNITDTGTGTHSINHFENLNALAGEKRAIHLAFRQMLDSVQLAERMGIPKTIAYHTETDLETGIAFTGFMWMTPNTQTINVAFTVAYGVRAGRALKGSTAPGEEPAGTALDYAAVRIVEA